MTRETAYSAEETARRLLNLVNLAEQRIMRRLW